MNRFTAEFTRYTSPDDVKRLYRSLAMEWHPDRNPHRTEEATERMKEINAAYHARLKQFDNTSHHANDGETRTYYYNEARETETAAKVTETIAREWSAHTEIIQIGTWLWIAGTRREDTDTRAQLNELKYRWHPKRAAWYWKPAGSYSRYNANKSLSDLAGKHGYKRHEARTREDETTQQPH